MAKTWVDQLCSAETAEAFTRAALYVQHLNNPSKSQAGTPNNQHLIQYKVSSSTTHWY
jgi:hypothetical protein